MIFSMWDSPFIVPVVAMTIPIVVVVSSQISKYQRRRLQSEERLAAIAHGLPLPPEPAGDEETRIVDPRRQAYAQRTTAIILLAVSLAMVAFSVALSWIVGERDVLVIAAAALFPLLLGVGFFIDYRLRIGELNRIEAGSASGGGQGAH